MARVRLTDEERLARARAQVELLEARIRERQRKLRTRQLIVLGGALLARARREAHDANGADASLGSVRTLCAELVLGLTGADARVFEGWQPAGWRLPSPAAGDAAGPSSESDTSSPAAAGDAAAAAADSPSGAVQAS